jgi:hypothetical protein
MNQIPRTWYVGAGRLSSYLLSKARPCFLVAGALPRFLACNLLHYVGSSSYTPRYRKDVSDVVSDT